MIGMNIKQLRQEKHIKQDTLADAIGVSAQAVSKWETGASDPDIALLPKLANYFGVSIDELFEVPRAEKMERIQNMIWDERRIRPETFDRTVAYLEGILKEDPKDAEAAIGAVKAAGEKAFVIGTVESGVKSAELV